MDIIRDIDKIDAHSKVIVNGGILVFVAILMAVAVAALVVLETENTRLQSIYQYSTIQILPQKILKGL